MGNYPFALADFNQALEMDPNIMAPRKRISEIHDIMATKLFNEKNYQVCTSSSCSFHFSTQIHLIYKTKQTLNMIDWIELMATNERERGEREGHWAGQINVDFWK